MKQIVGFVMLVVFVSPMVSFAQGIDTLFVNDNKFINLHFNTAVNLTQSSQPEFFFIEKKQNVLFVQALQNKVLESNLFVQTVDGKYYNYIVKYTANLQRIVYDYSMGNAGVPSSGPAIAGDKPVSLQDSANPLVHEKGYINSRNRVSKGRVELYFKGIYSQGDKLLLLVYLQNLSSLSYGLGDIKLFIKHARKLKNIAAIEQELFPKVYPYSSSIASMGQQYITLEFEKTALVDKVLSIDLIEKNGDRNLTLQVNPDFITNAKVLK